MARKSQRSQLLITLSELDLLKEKLDLEPLLCARSSELKSYWATNLLRALVKSLANCVFPETRSINASTKPWQWEWSRACEIGPIGPKNLRLRRRPKLGSST